MHADEVSYDADDAEFARDARVEKEGSQTHWRWAAVGHGSHRFTNVVATLDWDGHLFVAGEGSPATGESFGDMLDAFMVWATDVYMEVLAHWTLMHADVLRGIIELGKAAVCGRSNGNHMSLHACWPGSLSDLDITPSSIYPVLFTEAARTHVYSTLAQQRVFGKELIAHRERVLTARVGGLEAVSIAANERVQFGRTVRTRLEVAEQTLRNRLQNHPESIRGLEKEIVDILLVSQHMQTTWANQGANFEWVVEHARLRVSISERTSSRTIAAAVFSVGIVALLTDFISVLLSKDLLDLSWRGLLLSSGGPLAITACSAAFYLLIKGRFMRE